MKFAFCNEMFLDQPFPTAWSFARDLGYTGVEIAPFTFLPGAELAPVTEVSESQRQLARQQAADAGLEVIGLHWLLAKTDGLYLTSPDADVRKATAEYLGHLAQFCKDLGGSVMVLGSPQQRNLLPGVSYEEAEQYAAEVLRLAMPACADSGVTIAVEPLGPDEGDFLVTVEQGIRLAELVDSPNCQLHLDVKAISSETKPIGDVIRDCREWTVHFHANDPNLLGPGMGEVEFPPILEALLETGYDGWVSVEVFRYEPSPEEIARQSIEYLKETLAAVS